MYKLAPGCNTPIMILAQPEMAEMAQNVHRRLAGHYNDGRFGFGLVNEHVFNGGELYPSVRDTRIKNMYIFLFHSLRYPDNPNTSLIELYLTIGALARASVRGVTLVSPYLSYSRQDRKDKPRVPISSRDVADLLTSKPVVDRVITFSMHSDQGQGFYNIPVDNLPGDFVLANYLRGIYGEDFENVVAVSPDRGSWKRVNRFAKFCKPEKPWIPCACLDKNRDESGVEFPEGMISDVVGKRAVMIDDECATGDTFIGAGQATLQAKAASLLQGVTHWIACKKEGDPRTAEEKFRASGLKIITTNSIPRPKEYLEENKDWLTMVPVDDFLADVIYQATLIGGSISELFATPTRKCTLGVPNPK